MKTTQYTCKNYDNCKNADSKTKFDLTSDQKPECPECKSTAIEPTPKPPFPKWMKISIAVAMILAILSGSYFFISSGEQHNGNNGKSTAKNGEGGKIPKPPIGRKITGKMIGIEKSYKVGDKILFGIKAESDNPLEKLTFQIKDSKGLVMQTGTTQPTYEKSLNEQKWLKTEGWIVGKYFYSLQDSTGKNLDEGSFLLNKIFASGYYGAVEIGSSGVKAIIAELSPDPQGNLKVKKNSLIEPEDTNPINPEMLDKSLSVIKKMYELLKNSNIPEDQIFIYGSSGLAKADVKHKNMLTARIQEETGKILDFLNKDRETILARNKVIELIRQHRQQERRWQTVYIDIGSGNTKGCYNKKENELEEFEFPFGTKTLAKDFAESKERDLMLYCESKVIPQLSEKINNHPGLQNLNRIYLAGGITWSMMLIIRPDMYNENLNFWEFSPQDIDVFYDTVTKTGVFDNILTPDMVYPKKVREDIERIKRGIFSLEQLKAGATLLKVLSEKLSFKEKAQVEGNKMFFVAGGMKSLMLGYIEDQVKR